MKTVVKDIMQLVSAELADCGDYRHCEKHGPRDVPAQHVILHLLGDFLLCPVSDGFQQFVFRQTRFERTICSYYCTRQLIRKWTAYKKESKRAIF